jgi:four helix bundle protein
MGHEERSSAAGPIKSYRDLLAYPRAYKVALHVSKVSRTFPQSEQFELTSQMRRAARSIPANLAEGWARRQSAAEFRRFLQMAIGSCEEMKVWLDFSRDEGYVAAAEVDHLQQEYGKIGLLLSRLWTHWRKF